MSNTTAKNDGVNRAKLYQLALFPLNNGATNVYFVLILSYVAQFGSSILQLGLYASLMVTIMRICDAITDPIIGALMDRTSTRWGKFRPFMVIGSVIMAISVICLYILLPLVPETMMAMRYILFTLIYFVWVIGYTFQTSVTRAGQTVLTNDPNQRPMFTIFNTIGSMLGMGVMQFLIPLIKNAYNILDESGAVVVSGYARPELYAIITPIGIGVSVLLTILAIIGIAEKDRPEYYGIGGSKQEKVKLSEYMEIIRNNKPMKRLMVAGAGCKLALLIVSSVSNPNLLLSFPYNGGGAINLYTVLFILCFGIGYGAYYATADMPIPMVADCSDYETYRSGKYIPGIMGTLFSLVDKLVSSLAQTLVALIFLWCAGLSELPTDATPYSTGIKVAVIIMFCVIPMLAWAATLWAMKGYSLTGAKMKEIQAVNRARKAAVNDGMTLEQAMDTIKTTEDAEKYQTTGGKTASM